MEQYVFINVISNYLINRITLSKDHRRVASKDTFKIEVIGYGLETLFWSKNKMVPIFVWIYPYCI